MSPYQVEGAYDDKGKGALVQDTKVIPDGIADFKVSSDRL
ncbi:hypothetical protein [Clostridium uliginosum]